MKRIAFAVVVSFALALPCLAANQRSFVSFFGSDANTCVRDHPCRNFAAAVAQTNPGGEVVVLDSAGYGVVSITQSVTIVAPLGVHAALSVFPTEVGVMVNAGSGDVVLRNLYVNSQGGITGIQLQTGASLHLEHCVINGFSGHGLTMTPLNQAEVFISDTVSRANDNAGLYADGDFGLTVSIANSRFAGNTYGVLADQATVSMDHTNCDSNSFGVFSRGTGTSPTFPLLTALNDCSLSHNDVGVQAESGELTIRGGSISNNGSGILLMGGSVAADHCVISGHTVGSGIVISSSASLSLVETTLVGAVHGIHIQDAPAFVQLNRCTIARNANGVTCEQPYALRTSGDNVIDSNVTNVGVGCTFVNANVN